MAKNPIIRLVGGANRDGNVLLNSYFGPRGLDPEALGCEFVTAPTAANLMGYQMGSGIIIPYHDADGVPLLDGANQFMRIRRWPYEGSSKYRQARGTGVHAYLTPGMDWPRIMAIKDLILFGEGEFKAAKVCTTPGWPPMVGLGGVDSWGPNRLIPELEAFNLHKRPVGICYDSDMHDNPQIQRALARFAGVLDVYGAEVFGLDIAATGKVAKGVDDYIVAGGTWTMLELTKFAIDPSPMTSMLARFAMMQSSEIIDTFNGDVYRIKQFHDFMANVIMDVGDKRVPVSAAWQRHKRRVDVKSQTLNPAEPWGIVRTESGDSYFNMWRGFATEPERVEEWYDGVVDRWMRFVLGLMGGDVALATLFHQWCAWIWRNPSVRNYTSWVLVSPKEGIGKSLLGEIVAAAIGVGEGLGARQISPEDLFHKYPTYAEGTVFMLCDEVRDSQDRHRALMKDLRTNDTQRVERKNLQPYRVPNYLNLVITTNEAFAYGMSATARRDIVVEACAGCEGELLDEWKAWIRDEVAPMRRSVEALKCLAYWWMHEVDMTGYDHTAEAPYTEAKEHMARAADGGNAEIRDAAEELVDKWGGSGVIPSNWLKGWYRMRSPEVVARWEIFCRCVRNAAGYMPPESKRKIKVDGVAIQAVIFGNTQNLVDGMNKADEVKRSRSLPEMPSKLG